MSQTKKSQDSQSAPSLWSAIIEVIKGLKDQPILLFLFGLAIIVFAAGALAIESFRVVAITLLLLAILGMIVWIAVKAFARITPRPTQSDKNKGGSLIMGKNVKGVRNKIDAGNVETTTETHGKNEGGNFIIGNGSDLEENDIHVGNIKVGKQYEEKKN